MTQRGKLSRVAGAVWLTATAMFLTGSRGRRPRRTRPGTTPRSSSMTPPGRSETYTLDFTGITPHPNQGFHVKLTVNAEGSRART